jgi:hypothetical protein
MPLSPFSPPASARSASADGIAWISTFAQQMTPDFYLPGFHLGPDPSADRDARSDAQARLRGVQPIHRRVKRIGEFESGGMARLLGPVGSALFGGCGAILVTLMWASLFPALRKADRLE